MPEKGLRLVLSFDAQSQSFKPAAHNLPADQVVGFADQLHADDGVDSRIVEQKTRHKAKSAEACSQCNKAAEAETKKSQEEPEQQEKEPAAGDEHDGQ
jgi:hypothetical protein